MGITLQFLYIFFYLQYNKISLKEGDSVLVNGWGIGTDHFGGYAGEARLK